MHDKFEEMDKATEISFVKTFSWRNPFIAEHQVKGAGLLPAAVQIEIALAGFRALTGSISCKVSDVSFTTPVEIKQGEEKDLTLTLRRNGAGIVYTLTSSDTLQGKTVQHSKGVVSQATAPLPNWEQLTKLQSSISGNSDALINEWYRQSGIDYGPSFRCIRYIGMESNGPGEMVMLLNNQHYTTDVGKGQYIVEPPLLDGALQGMGLWLSAQIRQQHLASDVPYFPYYIKNLLINSAVSGKVWVKMDNLNLTGPNNELVQGNFRFFNEQGMVLAILEGVTLKRAGPSPTSAIPLQTLQPDAVSKQFFHEVAWREKAGVERSLPKGLWLVFNDIFGTGNEVGDQLVSQGNNVVKVNSGRHFFQHNENEFTINPTAEQDYIALLTKLKLRSEKLCGIIHLWRLTPYEGLPADASSLDFRFEEGVFSLISLFKAIGVENFTHVEVLAVSSNAYSLDATQHQTPDKAAMAGVVKAAAIEYPNAKIRLLDLPGISNGNAPLLAKLIIEELVCEATDVVAGRYNEKRLVPEVKRQLIAQNTSWSIRTGGTYLITGGIGGIGLEIAMWLVKQGAKTIILLGRSPLPTHNDTQESIAELAKYGAVVDYISGDVADQERLAAICSNVSTKYGKLHGVIHCSGVIKDALLRSKTLSDAMEVMRSKAHGALALALTTAPLDLDFLIFFSSISAIFGNIGQADYAAANAFMDSLANLSFSNRKKVMSLNWGPWAEVGMLAKADKIKAIAKYFVTIPPATGCHLLAQALAAPAGQRLIFSPVVESNRSDLQQPEQAQTPQPPATALALNDSPKEPDVDKPDICSYLTDLLAGYLAEALAIPKAQLGTNSNLLEYGITSLIIADVKARLEQKNINVDPSLFFRFPTIEEIVTFIMEEEGEALVVKLGFTAPPLPRTVPDVSTSTHSALTNSLPIYTSAFLRRRIMELSAEDVAARENNEYFYEPVITRAEGAWVWIGQRKMLMLASYSYLDLIGHPRINAAAMDAIKVNGTGTHGVRLLAGTNTLHRELELTIARFKNTEDAIVYSSGFGTNYSTISCLVGRGDYVIGDMYNHASIVDGCTKSGANFLMFAHNDMADLERCLKKAGQGSKLVVVDAVFSMEGDIINLPETVRLCRHYEAALMVDEAHSLGVLGRRGHGIEEHFQMPGDTVEIKMGTLSKAIPSVGGYIAGSKDLIFALKNNSRAFVFSAALPLAQVAAAKEAFAVIDEEPHRVEQLRKNIRLYIDGLAEFGLRTCSTETSIVPVLCSTSEQALELARLCQQRNVFVQPIVYPAVPIESPRLRTIITAAHTEQDIRFVLSVLSESAREVRLI